MGEDNEILNRPVLISRQRCGCVAQICADEPNMYLEIKNMYAEANKSGCTIERRTVGWVREHGMEQCEKHAELSRIRQLELL